uniref:Uncharacterized protein n=1 Tax=Anguilla anguilla TaxID=7936 RepID=A0A0E9X7C0_ANGAN
MDVCCTEELCLHLERDSLHNIVMHATNVTYSWKSTVPLLSASRLLKILSNACLSVAFPNMSPISLLRRSVSSPLVRVLLSPSFPEYWWKALINIDIPFCRLDISATRFGCVKIC